MRRNCWKHGIWPNAIQRIHQIIWVIFCFRLLQHWRLMHTLHDTEKKEFEISVLFRYWNIERTIKLAEKCCIKKLVFATRYDNLDCDQNKKKLEEEDKKKNFVWRENHINQIRSNRCFPMRRWFSFVIIIGHSLQLNGRKNDILELVKWDLHTNEISNH